MKYFKRFINYLKGIKIKCSPMLVNWENQTFSKTTMVLISCHPSDSITWHWVVYSNIPHGFGWIFNMGLQFRKQKLMYN